MALRIVNPQPNYPPVKLIEPAPLGYLHVAAVVDPSRGRIPFPGNSPQKAALLTRLTSLGRQLERLSTVEKATVYRAISSPRQAATPSRSQPSSRATTSSCSSKRPRRR